jgi:serine/threonine protein kinase
LPPISTSSTPIATASPGKTTLPTPPSNDLHIGRYQVERVLGKGAMGVVYLGRDPHINRLVAIKTVPLPQEEVKGENDLIADKFFREAQAAGKLAHAGIVTVFDAGTYRDNVYIAMEYLEGLDLSHYTDPARLLPLATTLNLIARVAEALHFAHERGVVHRDIKPANIIFDSRHNVVKVTDFGIAYIHDNNRAMTQVLVGSPNYMSPEHLTGDTLDGRSDLFSLGVTLFVLACGKTPFSGDNVSRLMYSILNEPPLDIRQFNPSLPASVVAILDRALQKDRQTRYSSGASMAQDLMIAIRNLDKLRS